MNQTVYLNPNACNSDQEWFFYGGYNSVGGLPVEGASCEKKIGNLCIIWFRSYFS